MNDASTAFTLAISEKIFHLRPDYCAIEGGIL